MYAWLIAIALNQHYLLQHIFATDYSQPRHVLPKYFHSTREKLNHLYCPAKITLKIASFNLRYQKLFELLPFSLINKLR